MNIYIDIHQMIFINKSPAKAAGIFMLILLITSCRPGGNGIRKAVEAQLQQYPESRLQDIYKSFFQDEFGPGHLIGDTAGAGKYLDFELAEMVSKGNYSAEPCGLGDHFFRVPMDLVKDGKIPRDDYFNAFLESAASFKDPDPVLWNKKWEQIIGVIKQIKPPVKDFEKDREMIREMMAAGETVVHHSRVYSENYDPHYRIMGKIQWNKLAEKYDLKEAEP